MLRRHIRWRDRKKLFFAVDELRSWMGPKRVNRPKGYLSHAETLGSYLAYYFPLHLGEVYWILEQHPNVVDFDKIDEVWDLGAGPGTSSVSLLLWLQKNNKKVPKIWTVVDSSQRAMDVAEELLHSLDKNIEVRKIRVNIFSPDGLKRLKQHRQKNIFFLASHFLNELGSGPRRRGDKKRFLDMLSGHVLIIEPPLREPTLDLMSLRDELCDLEADAPAAILAPCPKAFGKCPMLARSMGWCYAQPPRMWLRSVNLDHWEVELRDLSGTLLQEFGFSYLLYRRDPTSAMLEENQGTDIKSDKRWIQISDTRNVKTLLCEGQQIVSKAIKTGFRGMVHRQLSSSVED